MKKSYTYLLIGAMIVIALGYTCYTMACNHNREVGRNDVSFRHSISDSAMYRSFAGQPLDNTFSDVQSVKVVYDIHANELYYINSNKYRLHFDFCEEVLDYSLGLAIFNTTNYSNSLKRDYYLATLNYFKQSNVFALEFFADNEMTAKQIKQLYDLVSASFYDKAHLRIFLNNENIIAVYNTNELSIPTVGVDEVYKNQRYQQIQEGSSVGILHIIDSVKQLKDLDSHDGIIVIRGTPLEMPLCRAFISNTFQTPLSHIQVLAHQRNIPAAALKDCLERYKKLDGKPVRITILRDSIRMDEVTLIDLAAFNQKVISRTPVSLEYDTTATAILPIDQIRKNQKQAIGNKAYNFSQLATIVRNRNGKFLTPESGYAIPYSFYYTHIHQPAIQTEINKLALSEKQGNAAIRKQLKQIQKVIKETPLDISLRNEMTNLLRTSSYKAFRFRSSCNAEDMEGFSGAGLYDSYTGTLNDTSKTVEEAIKKVWASTFNYRAYIERRQFAIREESVMMGILVHRSFPDERSNGVVITKNIYRDDYPGFVVNVQQGDISVVNPPEGVTCDQFICSPANLINPLSNQMSVKYLSKSSIATKGTILSSNEVERLYDAANQVTHFYKDIPYIDIEFKFEKNGKLYLKQVRPYK